MTVDEHNDNIDRIIAKEQATMGITGPVDRMMRSDVGVLIRRVGGRASVSDDIIEKQAVEVANKTEQIEQLEAVISELRKRLEDK